MVVASRYDSCLTAIPLEHLGTFKERIYEEVQDVKGKLIVKEYPTKTASTQTVRNHLEKLRMRDTDVDMIIIDYGDLLRPVRYLERENGTNLNLFTKSCERLPQNMSALYGQPRKPIDRA